MHADIERVLLSRQQIAARVEELARQITADHLAANPLGEITLAPILTGAMIFCGDLMRHIPLAIKIGLMIVSSYPGKSVSSQGAHVVAQQLGDVRGRHLLLLDDILDSGNTLRLVVPMLADLGAASIKTCVLLRKDRPAAREVAVDYVGFEIPDEFVVGYGLDFNDYYRNLPDIVTLRPSVVKG